MGAKGDVAGKKIEKENRNVDAIVTLEGNPVIKDLRGDGVEVPVNLDGVVVEAPRIG